MRIRLEYVDAKSRKFWEIEQKGTAHTVHYGRLGTEGQRKTSEFPSEAAAKKSAETLVAQKLKKGYRDVSGKAPKAASTKATSAASAGRAPKLPMDDYVERFTRMVEALRAHPQVCVTHFHVGDPVSASELAAVEEKLGCALDPAIRSFYRQANGLQLRWVDRGGPNYDEASEQKSKHSSTSTVALRGENDEQEGLVNILPLKQCFVTKQWKDELWDDSMEDRGDYTFAGKRWTFIDFHRSVRPFDDFSFWQAAAFLVEPGQPNPWVLMGEDHNAHWESSRLTHFDTYLEGVLAHYGHVKCRQELFMGSHKQPPLRAKPEDFQKKRPPLEKFLKKPAKKAPAPAAGARRSKNVKKPNWNARKLLAAVHAGKAGEVAALLRDGADPDATDRGEWALLVAVRAQKADIVQLLLEAGGDPHRHLKAFASPLHQATNDEKAKIAALLLQHGADPNRPANKDLELGSAPWPGGYRPLHCAARGGAGATQVIRALVAAGADPNLACDEGVRCLHLVGNPKVVAALVEAGADVNAQDAHGNTPLHNVATYGAGTVKAALAVFEELLARGADPKILAKRDTLLHAAARNESLEMVERVLEFKTDINARGEDGETPLHRALDGGVPRIVARLIDEGADLTAVSERGQTTLHLAVQHPGLLADVKRCLAAGVDPNATDDCGRTPLHVALELTSAFSPQFTSIVKALLDAGARRDVKNEDGKVPWDMAKMRTGYRGYEQMAKLVGPA